MLLVAALKKNTHLESSGLKNNDTEEGHTKLQQSVFDSTSMDSIVDSNHSCRVTTYTRPNGTQRPPLEKELLKINTVFSINDVRYRTVQQKIRRKVVLALCGVNGELFDLSH